MEQKIFQVSPHPAYEENLNKKIKELNAQGWRVVSITIDSLAKFLLLCEKK